MTTFQRTMTLICFCVISTQGYSAALTTDQQKYSYMVGYQLAMQLKGKIGNIDVDSFVSGIQDNLSGAATKLSQEEMNRAAKSFVQKQKMKQSKERMASAVTNQKEGDDFLKANKSKSGIVSLENGLQYLVLKSGQGKSPKASDKVVVHYQGSLINGTVFDSSLKRGKPVTFGLSGVIPGFREALLRMKEGDKWRVFLPATLAYGKRGAGQSIGPNQALIFEMESIEVKP